MKYNNIDVRRQDRLLEYENAIALLQFGEFGFLSMVEAIENNYGGYGIPVSYVWDGKESVYIHCAPEGHKIVCIKDNPNISFCVVGRTGVIPEKFTTAYESIIIRGVASVVSDAEECMTALRLFIKKYAHEHEETGIKYAEKSFHRTAIIRIDILTVSGKTK